MRLLDSLDRRLLRELQHDCRISAAALAERCGTTESTALRRWKQLVRDGVIERHGAIVDAAKVGWPLAMIVSIRIEREGPANTIDLIREISRHEAVSQFYHVTGTTDYVAILRSRSMEDYEDFVSKVLAADPRFATRTNVVIRVMADQREVPV